MDKVDFLAKLLEDLVPYKLIIEDDSHKHASHFHPKEHDIYPSHVKITVVSGAFSGLSIIARQRLVNNFLDIAFHHGLHSAVLKTLTIAEFKEIERIQEIQG